MARPTKYRQVEFIPETVEFIPVGKKKCEIETINLKIEELEAMRLKDILELSQEECAERMDVSRQTFQNIIESARKKITLALTEGKGIFIGGGNFKTRECTFLCTKCESWYGIATEKDTNQCPSCGSKEVVCKKKMKRCEKICKKCLK